MGYYVLLTGGKNNAGDFLIKYRAKKLLSEFRSDRDLIDFNAWEPFDDEKLEIVNNSKALILTGGPALQRNIYPGIYKLTDNLDRIKVPIISMGIGWKSPGGGWEDIPKYRLNSDSISLLDRLSSSGYLSSVRDYHTMHVLQNHGIDNVVTTGCPALYDLQYIGKPIDGNSLEKISFSLGVGFVQSKSMETSVKDMILMLDERFQNENFSVKFHHSIDRKFLDTPDSNSRLYQNNVRFSNWLEGQSINYEDISGSAESLIESYSSSDIHIGYRVHAHIFMSSISKPSILIAEDGRGKALLPVVGGIILDGFKSRNDGLMDKALDKVGFSWDRFTVDEHLSKLVIRTLDSEINSGLPRFGAVRNNIDAHFDVMRRFVNQLP